MAIKVLNPNATGFYNSDYSVTPPAGGGWSGDPVEYLSDTNHGTYVSIGSGGTTHMSFKLDEIPADVPGTTPVAEVRIFFDPVTSGCFPSGPTGIFFLARHGGTNAFSPDIAPVYDAGENCNGPSAIEEYVFPERPETGPWTVADFQGASRAEFGLKCTNNAVNNAKMWVKVTYQAIIPSYDAGREVAGRMLRMRRRILRTYEVKGPLWLLDAQLGDDVLVDYFAAEDPGGQGWLYKSWQRGWLKVVEVTAKPTDECVALKLLWMRDYAALWWDTMASESPAGLYGQGVARTGLGELRTFTRASAAWVGGPKPLVKGGGGLYYLAVDNVEKITSRGTIFMSARTNLLLHSSFVQGVGTAATGWTYSGNPTQGTIEAEVPPTGAPLLFERQVGARRVKIASAASMSADLEIQGTVTNISANKNCLVRFGHLDALSSQPLKYAIKRVVSAVTTWWRESDQTWQSSKTWNPLGGSTTTSVRVDTTSPMPFGATAGTLQPFLGFPNGETSRTGYAYHAEIHQRDADTYLSDELILTTTLAYTVVDDALVITNNSGVPAESTRVLPASGFTNTTVVTVFWSPSQLAAGAIKTVWAAEFDANNKIELLYSKDNARFELRYTRAGTTVTAHRTVLSGVQPNVAYTITVRVVGSAGELDMTPFTCSILVDGVKGTDAVPADQITMTSTASVKIGHRGSVADKLDGIVAHFETSHEVLSDLEATGRP